MNRCPITYELCGDQKYTSKGLKLLSKSLKHLKDFPYTPKEQIQMAAQFASKLSIQGVQPKLSVILNVKEEVLKIVEKGGRFIIKPPHHLYEEVPQNEDLTMRLAKIVGIEVPFHGMIYNIDGSLSYVIKRFDRSRTQKIAVEDFTQLLGYSRETKYESSMEKVISVIEKHCTFPVIEKLKLFCLMIFNFLIGNEDMHLKNFTLIRYENRVELSPAYDLLNTTIIMKAEEEIALPIRGKKKRLNRSDFVEYFGMDRLGLSESVIKNELLRFENSLDTWNELIQHSFLSEKMRNLYKQLIKDRWHRLSNNGPQKV
jgi:serine/threonine-protein kinase HipA